MTRSNNNNFLENNGKDDELDSGREIFLLKQAFCRISKRLVLIENFLQYKFDREFPPESSYDFVKVNVHTNTNALGRNSNRHRLSLSKSNKIEVKKKACQPEFNYTEDVFHIDSDAEVKPIDCNNWEIKNKHDHYDGNDDHEVQDGRDVQPSPSRRLRPSRLKTDVVIDPKMDTDLNALNDDNSDGLSEHDAQDDSDYEGLDYIDASEYEEDIHQDKNNKALHRLHRENSSDSDYKPSHKGKSSPKQRDKNSSKNKNVTSSSALTKRGRGRPRLPEHQRNSRLTCEICNKVFVGSKAKYDLKIHMEIHSADKKYVCPICNKAFRQKRPMRGHMQRVHQKDKFAVRGCQFCEKKFIGKDELEKHESTHTGDKRYSCEICDFRCVQAYYFKQHMNRHAGMDTSVLCPECGKSFKSRHRLKAHTQNIHEGDFGPDGKKLKTFSCEICPSVLINPLGLKMHMKNIHGIKADSKIKSNSNGPQPQISEGTNEETEETEAVTSIPTD